MFNYTFIVKIWPAIWTGKCLTWYILLGFESEVWYGKQGCLFLVNRCVFGALLEVMGCWTTHKEVRASWCFVYYGRLLLCRFDITEYVDWDDRCWYWCCLLDVDCCVNYKVCVLWSVGNKCVVYITTNVKSFVDVCVPTFRCLFWKHPQCCWAKWT